MPLKSLGRVNVLLYILSPVQTWFDLAIHTCLFSKTTNSTQVKTGENLNKIMTKAGSTPKWDSSFST